MLAIEEVLKELSGEEINELGLPPGFRFHPTDEELITYYLASKVYNASFSGVDIAEVDLNRCEPWELPDVAKMGEREWYFFSLRDRKYPTGLRTNRATGAGYWKATGKDREVYSASSGALLGMKKTLVFYKGRAPRGEKTKWVMHEYRLDGDFSSRHTCKEEWVMCRIYHKTWDKKNPLFQGRQSSSSSSYHLLEALPALMETTPTSTDTNSSSTTTNNKNNNSNSVGLPLQYQTQNPMQLQAFQNQNQNHPLFLNHHHQDDYHLKNLINHPNVVNQQSQLCFPMNHELIQPSFSPTSANNNSIITTTTTATTTSTCKNTNNNNSTSPSAFQSMLFKSTTSTCKNTNNNNNTSPSAFQSMLFKSLLSHQDSTSKEQQQLSVPIHCKTEASVSSHFQPMFRLPLQPNTSFFYCHQNQNKNPPQPTLLFDQMDDADYDGVLGFSSAAAQLHDMSTSLAFNRAGFQISTLDPSLTKLPGGESWPPDA